MLNQQRLDKSKATSDEIAENCKAMEEFNKDANEDGNEVWAAANRQTLPYKRSYERHEHS